MLLHVQIIDHYPPRNAYQREEDAFIKSQVCFLPIRGM